MKRIEAVSQLSKVYYGPSIPQMIVDSFNTGNKDVKQTLDDMVKTTVGGKKIPKVLPDEDKPQF